MDDFLKKVCLILKAKYDIEEDLVLEFMHEIEQCYAQEYTPRRTAEVVAHHLFEWP